MFIITSAERAFLIKIRTTMKPSGIYVPNPDFFLTKYKLVFNEKLSVEPIGRTHSSGWIQTYLFTQWFYINLFEASPILLLLMAILAIKKLEILTESDYLATAQDVVQD